MRREGREWIAGDAKALPRDVCKQMLTETRALDERVESDVPVVVLWEDPAVAARDRAEVEAGRRGLIEGRRVARQRHLDRDRHALRLRHSKPLVDEAVRA